MLISGEYSITTIVSKDKKISYKGMTGFWTKWGGARESAFGSQHEVLPDVWACQSCSKDQPLALGASKYHLEGVGWLNVCAACKHNGCRELIKRRRCEP